jgi:hypothetical protein
MTEISAGLMLACGSHFKIYTAVWGFVVKCFARELQGENKAFGSK